MRSFILQKPFGRILIKKNYRQRFGFTNLEFESLEVCPIANSKIGGIMSETQKRIISGFSLAGIFIASFNIDWYYNILLFLFTFFLGMFTLDEFYNLTALSEKRRPHKKTGMAAGALALFLLYAYSLHLQAKSNPNFKASDSFIQFLVSVDLSFHLSIGLLLFLLLLLLLWQLIRGEFEGTIYSIGSTLFGILYVPVTFGHIFLLNSLPHGNFLIWLVAWSTAMSDTMAYFSGIAFGKTKVGIKASPNKTYEGYIGGFLGQLFMTHLFYQIAKAYFDTPQIGILELSLFSFFIYIVGVIGDLSESALKRDVGVKDSGNKIPGHGGFLDLADALMLTIPVSYYFMYISLYVKS
ncbi:MAG: hypothetical protein D6767_04655 [Candidatus Hydrogenedentota bacterium]|nr:MAG: hypothetical protein D6767_04655 [Candidatus Hydrogenedentota bacterium]